MRRTWVLSLATLVFALVFGALLMEVTIRVYAGVNRRFAAGFKEFDPMAVQIEPHGDHGYRQRPNSIFHYINGTTASSNAERYRGPLVSPQPAPGTVRIILLGGSTTHGWGVPDDSTTDAFMRAIFRERFPDRKFEVVNLAFDGYDTYQALQRLKTDGLRMRPTVVVVNKGINDVRNAQFRDLKEGDPRTLIWETDLVRLRAEQARGGPTIWTRLKHLSYLIRAPGYVREQMHRRAAPSGRVSGSGSARAGTATDGPPYPDAAVFFERHVREIVRLSQENGAAVLLSTPPSALHWYGPHETSTQSYWIRDAETTQAYRDSLSRRLKTVTAEEKAAGHAVAYVAPVIPERSLFLDDCHLTSQGNRLEAAAFVDAIIPLLDQLRSARGQVKQ